MSRMKEHYAAVTTVEQWQTMAPC